MQIAYLDEEPALNEDEEPRVYSALIDGHCEMLENGRRRPNSEFNCLVIQFWVMVNLIIKIMRLFSIEVNIFN